MSRTIWRHLYQAIHYSLPIPQRFSQLSSTKRKSRKAWNLYFFLPLKINPSASGQSVTAQRKGRKVLQLKVEEVSE